MKPALWIVMVVALVAPLAAIGFGGGSAFACSVRQDFNPATESDAVVYATVDRVARDWHYPDSEESFLLTLHVQRTLRGTPQAGYIEASTQIFFSPPSSDCPQFDAAKLVGRTAVIGLTIPQQGVVTTSRLATWFTDEPLGSPFADALAALLQSGTGTRATPAPPSVGSGAHPDSGPQLAEYAIGVSLLVAAVASVAAIATRRIVQRQSRS